MEINEIKSKDESIFDNVSMSSVLKEIYDNSARKRKQIDILIGELRLLIKTIQDAALVVPLIKEYMEVAVKNDEQLVKMISVYQKYIAAEKRVLEAQIESGNASMLSEAEKKQLLNDINEAKIITEEAKLEDKKVDEELSTLIQKMDIIKEESISKSKEKM